MALSLLLPIVLPGWKATQDGIVLEGYQMYAVDNWVQDRKEVPILVVHTGDATHKITVSAIAPPSQADWHTTLATLRRHAKSKETPYGTLLVTSLAQFRSDYTIVQIPDGDLSTARQQLYTNITLLRMGCSGRSGLTLEEPSDTTKDRFISTYFLPDNHLSGAGKAPILFNDTVLELVKLVQVSLHIFGYYTPTSFDGLLCDFTVEGLKRWAKEMGEQLVEGLEPMQRTVDPSTVAALLSLVLAVRNRLVGLSGNTNVIPKDPFLHPRLFTRALAAYLAISNPNSHSSHSLVPPQMLHSASSKSSHSPRQSISHSSHGGSPHLPTPSIPTFLKDQLAHLAHDNFAHSLPTVPTIHTLTASSSSPATSPVHTSSVPNTSRVPYTALSAETLSGTSTPTLALTVPTPPASAFHTPAMVSRANSNQSVFIAAFLNGDLEQSSKRFPSIDNSVPDTNYHEARLDAVSLTRPIIESIFASYDAKLLKSSPEVRRAVRKEQKASRKKDSVSYVREDDGKDGLTSIAGLPSVAPHSHLLSGNSLPLAAGLKTGLTSGITGTLASSLTGGNTFSGAASILMPISDLEEFIGIIVGEDSGYRKRNKEEEKKEKKERVKVKVKEKGERKEREKEMKREREKKEPDYSLYSSSSDGLVEDLSKAAKKVKAKVKGRSAEKIRDQKADERAILEGKDSTKDPKKQRKDKNDSVGGVGGLVLGLWTGRVGMVVKLRERAEERERERERAIQISDSRVQRVNAERDPTERDGVRADAFGSWRSQSKSSNKSSKAQPSLWSDGDTDSHSNVHSSTKTGKRASLPGQSLPGKANMTGSSRSRYGSLPPGDKSDEKSTEEEGPMIPGADTLGALWARSGKVRDKLESWAGLSKVDTKLTKQRLKSATLTPHAESNVVDLSPDPSPVGSPSIPNFVLGGRTSPIHSPSSSPSAPKMSIGGKLTLLPSLGPISPSNSQFHLQSQPHSPLWNMEDDDDLLSSGQVSPVGFGSAYALGLDSGNEDPRTPKAWPNDYFSPKNISSHLGSPFSRSLASVGGSLSGRKIPQQTGEGRAPTHSSSSTSIHRQDDVKRIAEGVSFLSRGYPSMRPWPGNRIPYASRVSSWSDPVSAREDIGISSHTRNSSEVSITDEGQESEDRLNDEEMDLFQDFNQRHRRSSTTRQAHKATLNNDHEKSRSLLSGNAASFVNHSHRSRSRSRARSVRTENYGSKNKSKLYRLEDDIPEEEETTQRMLGLGPRRRRSFHSLSTYRNAIGKVDGETPNGRTRHQTSVKVLPIDRMRIDVELCGYYLIMWRRAEHLANVVATLQILTSRLSDTNIHMREHYDSHLPDLVELESHVKAIAEVDIDNANTMKISQATKMLWYEAEQFRVPDLWHIASPPRQTVLAMREKISGTGGRRFPQGVHGAHGPFNRLQWTLDGRERLVNLEGKTESEVEEELRIDEEGDFISPPKEDLEDVVQNPSIKPMWLLRFFTNWGASWGASASSASVKGRSETSDVSPPVVSETSEEIAAPSAKLEKAASL